MVQGSVILESEILYYTFFTGQSGNYSFTSSGSLSVKAILYDENRQQLAVFKPDPQSNNPQYFVCSYSLNRNTIYYLTVESALGGQTGAFDLLFKKAEAAPEPVLEPAFEPITEQTSEPTATLTEEPAQMPIEETSMGTHTALPRTRSTYILTINYTDEQGTLIPTREILPENPAKVELSTGESYMVALPIIEGYTCTVTSKEVSMGTQDGDITIVYKVVSETEAPVQNVEPDDEVKLNDHLDEIGNQDGPYVVIQSDAGTEAELGDKITLTAELYGFSGLEVTYQWQRYDGQVWENIEGETSNKYIFNKLDNTAFGDWRVVVSVMP